MALIRIEPKKDFSSDLYYVEIFYPADAEQPFVTTEPRYKTAAAAERTTSSPSSQAGPTIRRRDDAASRASASRDP
jgi:hypothetical protein